MLKESRTIYDSVRLEYIKFRFLKMYRRSFINIKV